MYIFPALIYWQNHRVFFELCNWYGMKIFSYFLKPMSSKTLQFVDSRHIDMEDVILMGTLIEQRTPQPELHRPVSGRILVTRFY